MEIWKDVVIGCLLLAFVVCGLVGILLSTAWISNFVNTNIANSPGGKVIVILIALTLALGTPFVYTLVKTLRGGRGHYIDFGKTKGIKDE